jgi:hypothetical protein
VLIYTHDIFFEQLIISNLNVNVSEYSVVSPVVQGEILQHGEDIGHVLTESAVDALRMDCKYANPATDKLTILSAMSKTAAARQSWIRTKQPSITEVLDQYPRLEDMPFDLVCGNHKITCSDILTQHSNYCSFPLPYFVLCKYYLNNAFQLLYSVVEL